MFCISLSGQWTEQAGQTGGDYSLSLLFHLYIWAAKFSYDTEVAIDSIEWLSWPKSKFALYGVLSGNLHPYVTSQDLQLAADKYRYRSSLGEWRGRFIACRRMTESPFGIRKGAGGT